MSEIDAEIIRLERLINRKRDSNGNEFTVKEIILMKQRLGVLREARAKSIGVKP